MLAAVSRQTASISPFFGALHLPIKGDRLHLSTEKIAVWLKGTCMPEQQRCVKYGERV